jgi:hypothetical protein
MDLYERQDGQGHTLPQFYGTVCVNVEINEIKATIHKMSKQTSGRTKDIT